MIRAWVVDDEELAIRRLRRLLEESGRVEVAGTSTDPVAAMRDVPRAGVHAVFLDIQMPGMNGFELLEHLGPAEPLVVFTTAYHEYAIRAFEVNAVDYLLKPVEPAKLERALNRIERVRGGMEPKPSIDELMRKLATVLRPAAAEYPTRLASRTGDRIEFVELAKVTHFYAKDKLTFAATGAKDFCVDGSILELEAKLDPRRFVRIHRSTMVNIDYVAELHTWFGGKVLIRMRDEKKTELTVARDRVKALKDRLQV